jgi:hypothetical protein
MTSLMAIVWLILFCLGLYIVILIILLPHYVYKIAQNTSEMVKLLKAQEQIRRNVIEASKKDR